MSERSSARRRLAVAAVVAGLGVSVPGLLGVAIATPSGDRFDPGRYEVVAEFERAVGLYPDSRVYVDGLEAGEVTDVEVDLDQVRVTLAIDGVPVRGDATATLRLRSLIGERYVELDPPWTGDGPRLEDGDVIPSERTVVPAEVSDVLDEASRVADGLDGERLAGVIDELATAFGGNQDAVAGVVTHLADLGASVASEADALDAAVVSLENVVGDLAARDDRLVSILRSGTAVTQALLVHEDALDAAVTGLDRLLGQVNELAAGQRTNLTAAADGLDRLGRLLADHRADLARVTEALPLASYGFARAIHRDGDRWFLQPQVTGTLFAPFVPNMNSRGGAGSETGDNRLVPEVDFTGSALDEAIPYQIDTTPILGTGPLLPEAWVGPVRVDADGDGKVEQ